MAFKQVGQCLPQYLRQSIDAAKTVQDMKDAFVRQQREAGHHVVECGDDVIVTADYAEVERRVLAGLTDEEKQRMQDAYTTEEGTKDNGTY